MKKIIIATVMMLVAASAFAQDWRSIYNKYSDSDNVSAVYISPAMFKLIGKIPDINVGENEDVNISPLIRSMNGFYLLDSENAAVSSKIHKEVEDLVKAGKYELLMEAKDDGEVIHMYVIAKGDTINGFVMIAKDGNESTFICLDGQMSRKSFEELIAEAAK